MEDIRFITKNLLLVTVSERNINGNPCIFLAEIITDKIKLLKKLQPNDIEKNWMPYHFNNNVYVIYSISPFVIKSLEIDDRKQIDMSNNINEKLKGYNGSTNGIIFNNNILFLIHKYDLKTEHRWLVFDPTTANIIISNPFIFFKHSYIEFPCSLSWYNNKIYISLGINDDKAVIMVVSPMDIIL